MKTNFDDDSYGLAWHARTLILTPRLHLVARLRDAISTSVLAALQRTADRAARLDVPKTWPVPDALGQVAATDSGRGLHVGILPPFKSRAFSGPKFDASD